MKSTTSVRSYFAVCTALQKTVKVFSRNCTHPVPYCITLIDLVNLEKALQDDQTNDSLLSLLTPEENELFQNFTYPKRRREWLGGRLAAKASVLLLLQERCPVEMFSLLSILPAGNGAPSLTSSINIAEKLPALSISHSDRFAVAIASEGESCGIDLQKITKQTERVADRFSNEKEVLLLKKRAPRFAAHEQLSMLWAAKEALKKAMLKDQPVIFQGVILEALETDTSIILHLQFPGGRNCPAKVNAVKLEDYFLAYTLADDCHA